MKYIVLTALAEKEGQGLWSSVCLELGVASSGENEEEATENLKDATILYLNTLEELGLAENVLREKGVRLWTYEPTKTRLKVRHQVPLGARVVPYAQRLDYAS